MSLRLGWKEIHAGVWWRNLRWPLGKPKLNLKDNIKVDLKELEMMRVDTGQLLQNRDMWWDVVKTVMDLGVSQNVASFLITEELLAP
jgi:hypothetical protein